MAGRCPYKNQKKKKLGQPISRVLYLAIIYLDALSPTRSSDLPSGRRRAAALFALSWSCSGWGLHGKHVTMPPGELLPHHFNLTTASPVSAVCFCCTFPIVTYARRYLASSPYGARTFLIRPADARNCLNYPSSQSLYHESPLSIELKFVIQWTLPCGNAVSIGCVHYTTAFL